jgi:hypothetical protein
MDDGILGMMYFIHILVNEKTWIPNLNAVDSLPHSISGLTQPAPGGGHALWHVAGWNMGLCNNNRGTLIRRGDMQVLGVIGAGVDG